MIQLQDAFFLDDEEKGRFSRHCMTPLMEKGLVAGTNPDNPMSPMQEYKRT